MKRRLALLLALACALGLLLFAPGAAAETSAPPIRLADLAGMDADSVFTMEQLLALLQETYALGYRDGQKAAGDPAAAARTPPALSLGGEPDYVLNTNSRRFHYPDCKSAAEIKPENRLDFCGTREEVIAMGYSPCGRCRP